MLELFLKKCASKNTIRGFWTLLYELGRGHWTDEVGGGGVVILKVMEKLRAQDWQSHCANIKP